MGKEACSPRNRTGNTAWQLFDGEGEGEEGEFERARRARALRVLARRNSPSLLFQPSSTNGVKLNASQGLS